MLGGRVIGAVRTVDFVYLVGLRLGSVGADNVG